jgi:transcriptional regulator with XRE-family HTH domain
MPVGSSWSEEFVRQLGERELRHAYMTDQVRTRIALQIRALRDQAERGWSQAELGRRAGKPQNVISRIENPDYGQLTLQTLFDMAEAFDLPVYIDFSDWEDWLEHMNDMNTETLKRRSFALDRLVSISRTVRLQSSTAAQAAAEATKEASNQTDGRARLPRISLAFTNAALPKMERIGKDEIPPQSGYQQSTGLQAA